MKCNKIIVSVFLLFFVGIDSLCSISCLAQIKKEYYSELYGNCSLDRQEVCILNKFNSLAHQLKSKDTRYVVRDHYDLKGRTLRIPENSVLEFSGGSIENGTLIGDFFIVSAPCRIFKDVFFPSFITHGLDFRWFVGEDRKLSQQILTNLPSVPIYFGNELYSSDEEIDLSSVDYIDYHDLKLTFGKNIKAYNRTLAGGMVAVNQNRISNTCEFISPHIIKLSQNLPEEFENKIICIRTADRTLHDWRPLSYNTNTNVKGNPSLFKGLTTVIAKTDEGKVEFIDTLGAFSTSRVYSYFVDNKEHFNKPVFSTWAVLQPKHLELHDCTFVGTERYASILVGGKDIVINRCSFIHQKGSEVVLSINNTRGGYIHNCRVEGAWAGGNNGTNYGIQVNSSTAIVIDSCYFYNNRRGVDFSGEYESRYCTVSNCRVIGNDMSYHSGSALGGHSTSFGNSYLGNLIEGHFQVGIQCRGEQELIEGNTINAFCNGAVFVTSFNTIIRNNVVRNGQWGKNHTAFHIGNDYGFKSTITIEGNDIEIQQRFLHAYNPLLTTLIVSNNRINCSQGLNATSIAPNGFYGRFTKNEIRGDKSKIVDIPLSK